MAVSFQIFRQKKPRAKSIAMVSLYDAPSAALCCDNGVDALLVGDSMGNVILGYPNTIPVTIEAIAHHTGAVARGALTSSRPDVPVIADLPFGSYHGSRDTVVAHATTLMRAGAHGLKLEGAGDHALEAIATLTQMGVPVMGHLGFTPQSSLALTGVVQGKTARAAAKIESDARALQEAGCFGIVLEVMPLEVALKVTQSLDIATIGIGAGPHCDGQVLVWHDLIGLSPGPPLRFVRPFANARDVLAGAARDYASAVHGGEFPSREQGWTMPEDERAAWEERNSDTDTGH